MTTNTAKSESPTMALLKKKQAEGKISKPVEEAIADELDDADLPPAPEPVDEVIDESEKPAKASKSKAKAKKAELSPESAGTETPADVNNVKSLTQAGDALSDTVHTIETLDDEAKAIKLAHDMADRGEYFDFALGGVLSKIQQEGWLNGHDSLKDLIEKEFGFKYRKGVYLINNYNCISSLGLPFELFAGIGWKKLSLIATHLTAENYEDWLQRAKESTASQLQDYINALKANNGDVQTAEKEAKSLSTKSFKLHEDQKELVDDALQIAKEKGGTEHDSVALEYICVEFMAGGTVVNKKDKFDAKTADINELRKQLFKAVKKQFEGEDEQISAILNGIDDEFPAWTFDIAPKED